MTSRPARRPIRRSCSAAASGATSGAWWASTPTTASSTWTATRSCTSCSPGCRCFPTCTSRSSRCAGIPRRSARTTADRSPPWNTAGGTTQQERSGTMTVKIFDTPEVQDFLKTVAGLDQDGGDPRTKQIIHRLMSDLFKAVDDLDITPDEYWTGIAWLNALGTAGQAG